MNRRKVWFISTMIVTFSTLVLLATSSSLLTIPLSDAIPLGTFITWGGMISLPLTIYWGIRELRHPRGVLNTILATMLKIILVLAILWVPISYLLASNLSFTFSEKTSFRGGQLAMRWFWRLNYGIPIGAIFTLVVYWISLIFKKSGTVANKD